MKQYVKHYVDARVAAGEIQGHTVKTLHATLRTFWHCIGGLRLQEVTLEAIEATYIDLRVIESPSGKPLSCHSMYNVNLSAYLMFQHAKERRLVGENPLDKVPPTAAIMAKGWEVPIGAVSRKRLAQRRAHGRRLLRPGRGTHETREAHPVVARQA